MRDYSKVSRIAPTSPTHIPTAFHQWMSSAFLVMKLYHNVVVLGNEKLFFVLKFAQDQLTLKQTITQDIVNRKLKKKITNLNQ